MVKNENRRVLDLRPRPFNIDKMGKMSNLLRRNFEIEGIVAGNDLNFDPGSLFVVPLLRETGNALVLRNLFTVLHHRSVVLADLIVELNLVLAGSRARFGGAGQRLKLIKPVFVRLRVTVRAAGVDRPI